MSFICPHCSLAQVPTDANSERQTPAFPIGPFEEHKRPSGPASQTPHLAVQIFAIRCASFQCRKVTLTVKVGSAEYNSGWSLLAGSAFADRIPYPGLVGKPFPVGVPGNMLEDYREAWSIVDLSPKASATLARRCLQAMIHDFCNIRARSLYDEISELKKQADAGQLPKGVEAETVDAMHALREVGNYGAHMKERGGEILEVATGEAEALLGLIEMLFDDWYVAKAMREERLARIVAIADGKKNPPSVEPSETEEQPEEQ